MKRSVKIISLVIFTVVYILTRVPRIGTTIVNTDEIYWHARSQNFVKTIQAKDFSGTYQKYHPGVPIMWDFSITSVILSVVKGVDIDSVFNNFELIHTGTQVFLTVWFFLLSVLLIYLLDKIFKNWWVSLFSVLAFSIEPFYLGNARLIHHDAQISLCIILSLAFAYLYIYKEKRKLYLLFATFFLAVATLSKSLFLGAFVYCLLGGALLIFINYGIKKSISYFLTLIIGFVFFYVALFPAMWVAPVKTISRMFTESYVEGAEDGHTQVFFGVETRDPMLTFYPIMLFMKTSPFILIGISIYFLSSIYTGIKNIKFLGRNSFKNLSFILFITLFYFGYFLIINYFKKKIDRYLVSMYPFLGIISVMGWYKVKNLKIFTLVGIFTLFYTVVYPLISLFPHYLMYVNPIIGDAKDANEIVGQKLFGIGVFELRDKIVEKFGEDSKIGSNDSGPLSALYPKGVVYNVLVEHPNSFKVMVLGPNKKLPKAIIENPKIKFKQVDSVYINGLEFWRIYKRMY